MPCMTVCFSFSSSRSSIQTWISLSSFYIVAAAIDRNKFIVFHIVVHIAVWLSGGAQQCHKVKSQNSQAPFIIFFFFWIGAHKSRIQHPDRVNEFDVGLCREIMLARFPMQQLLI